MSQIRAKLTKRKIKNVKARRDIKRRRSKGRYKYARPKSLLQPGLDLFSPVTDEDKFHPIFKLLLEEKYGPERDVLSQWAVGFEDRDRKFVHEFQTTFESSMWELYLHTFLKSLDAKIDFSYSAPDFVASLDRDICIEATICAPAQNAPPPIGHSSDDIPDDLNEFNKEATIRLCNSFTSKVTKYRKSYSKAEHTKSKPYIIAIASFDRPFSHLSSNRPIMAMLYGVYFDEEATIESGAENVVRYPVDGVWKNENTSIPLGYFTNDQYKEVSAVVFSSLATWGKIRALADNRDALSVYSTFHPSEHGLMPELRVTKKVDYVEDLADGLQIFHNPFAENPISPDTFNHSRIAQYIPDKEGNLETIAPDDFLMLRYLNTINPTG